MGENDTDTTELKPDPANARRRVSLPVVALATTLVVISAGAAYAIGSSDWGNGDEPTPVAAEATTSESSTSVTPTEVAGPTTSERTEPEAPPTTTPGLLTGVPATPSVTASPVAAPPASDVSRSGPASETNQYAPITSTYERTTAVETTTMPLPEDVQKTLDEQVEQEGAIDAAPLGPGGAVVGGAAKDEESEEPEPEGRTVDESTHDEASDRPISAPADSDPAASEPTVTPEPDPAPEPTAMPEPDPAFEPTIAAEPVTAAELDAHFRAAFAPGASDGQLAAAFESGPALIPVGRALADGLPLLGGAVQWHLAEVDGVGDTATGQLVITTPLGTSVVPMTWVRTEGQWQISRESTCELGLALLGGCVAA